MDLKIQCKLLLNLDAKLLIQAGISKTNTDAIELQKELISNGKAYNKFLEMVEYQGGNPKDIENYKNLHQTIIILKLLYQKMIGYIPKYGYL